MNRIEDVLRNVLGITDEALLNKGKKIAHIRHYKKGEYLACAGEQQTGLCFLLQGLFRFYFLDAKGKEITDCFCYQYGNPVVPAIDYRDPLPINIVALEDSSVLVLPIAEVQQLMATEIETVRIYNALLMGSLSQHWETKMALYRFSGLQRYQWFIERFEGLIDRVPHVYIASYLGMSPVSLSRLRRQLKEQET